MTETKDAAPRVYLSPLVEADVDDRYLSWFDDTDSIKYYSGSGRRFDRESVVSELVRGRESGETFIYGIRLIESDHLIGTIKIGPIDHRNETSDLVVHIGERPNVGKGLASEAISLGNQIAFTDHGIRKLFGGMYAANEGAVRAYQNAGWVVEGRLRDHYLVDGQPMDRILVACFKYEPKDHD